MDLYINLKLHLFDFVGKNLCSRVEMNERFSRGPGDSATIAFHANLSIQWKHHNDNMLGQIFK